MFCSLSEHRSSGGAVGGSSAGDAGGQEKRQPRWGQAHVSDVSQDMREFERLHAVYVDFDAAVQSTRLYKYQVSMLYVFSCVLSFML